MPSSHKASIGRKNHWYHIHGSQYSLCRKNKSDFASDEWTNGPKDSVLAKMSPAALSELFLIGGISAVEARGDVETGNWTAVDRQGNNVTVHTLRSDDERIQMIGGSYDIAVWNPDGPNFAVIVSLFDQNNTTQTIKTLAVS